MKLQPIASKAISTLGMLAVGDAFAFAVAPKKHARVWTFGKEPKWYAKLTSSFTRTRPRAVGAAAIELALGAGLLAFVQHRVAPKTRLRWLS